MKLLATTLFAAGLLGSAALPALAQDAMDPATVTCADYMAMSAEDQTAAMTAMGTASAGAATTDDAAAADATTTDTATADAGTAGALDDAQMTAMMDACTADPSMMAMDAMTSAMGTGTN